MSVAPDTPHREIGGRPVRSVHLDNGALSVTLLSHGARLHDVRLAGTGAPLLAAPTDIRRYADAPWLAFGAVVGPVANRIAHGRARLGDRWIDLPRHEGQLHTLHGGPGGTQTRMWEVDGVSATAATFTLIMRDGADGFPANRIVAAHYALGPGAAITLTITATTDAPTWLNFASHPVWSLDARPDTSGHVLRVPAARYLPTDETALPTGTVAPVAGSPFDLRAGRPVGPATAPMLDHNFCLSAAPVPTPQPAAVLTGAGGLKLTVETTEAGLQVYDAARLAGGADAPMGHAGAPLGAYCGIALEPQGWPDAPNRADFPTVRLSPPATYRQVTRYSFDIP